MGVFLVHRREKLYSELGLESLSHRRYCRRLCFFYKIVNGYTGPYLSSYIPAHTRNCYVLRSKPAIKQLVARTERYQSSFFLTAFHNGMFTILLLETYQQFLHLKVKFSNLLNLNHHLFSM